MSKLQKQKNKRQESPKLLTTEVLEQKTAADLDRHNYSRAKEWLKELSKRNKDLYQPRLIDCYQKLAGQMLEKGQRNEAKTVFEQIRLLTGSPVDGRLEAQSLTLADDYRAAASAMVGRNGEEEGKPLTGAEGKALADNLVIAFEDIPELQKNHPELQRELLSVRTALEHLSAERFADAQSEVKAIGRSSIFADWRLFIKGLCAFYAGDDAKAREALRRFDGDSLLFRAARPFIHIINDGEAPLSKDEAKEPADGYLQNPPPAGTGSCPSPGRIPLAHGASCRFPGTRTQDVERLSDERAGVALRPVEILFPGALSHERRPRG